MSAHLRLIRVSLVLIDVLFGDRVEANDAAAEGLLELEVHFLRTLYVHSVDRVAVRLEMLQSLVLFNRVSDGVHERELELLLDLSFDRSRLVVPPFSVMALSYFA